MPLESLAYRFSFEIEDFPDRWLPLIHLYDPDLPLFPIYYFHVLPEDISDTERPRIDQRAFGYVEKIQHHSSNRIEVTIISNKDLDAPHNSIYLNPVISEVKERFGIMDSVYRADVANVFLPPLDHANRVLSEVWDRVVADSYGNKLPFGVLLDGVWGLIRCVASWNSPGGRKGELIQTHYFLSRFGQRIQSAGSVPQVDFYLLPSIKEFINSDNPLSYFPEFSRLIRVAELFHENFCETVNLEELSLSKFMNPTGGRLNQEKILELLNDTNIPRDLRKYAYECFNSFDKGPHRTVIILMMLADIRSGRLKPDELQSSQIGSIYDGLSGTYQAPKVISIYAQQSFGNSESLPIDTWVKTFLKWPLYVYPLTNSRDKFQNLLSHTNHIGKVERLIWVTSQARKVHSSACDNALWCMKYSSNGEPRGANPFACNICHTPIRQACPAYDLIRNRTVTFNNRSIENGFHITTSNGNNSSPNQSFIRCEGNSIYSNIIDDFSPADNPDGFNSFPASGHDGEDITVDRFIDLY